MPAIDRAFVASPRRLVVNKASVLISCLARPSGPLEQRWVNSMFRTLQSSLLLLLAVFLAHDSVCEAASVQVLAGDTPVVLRGRIGDDSSFVKRIGLVASISIPELILRSTDLHRSGG